MIYLDDCLNVLKKMDRKSVDLIYLDPPFFTQKAQKLGKDNRFFEFNDVWKSRDDYLSYMKERLILMKNVLKDTGSIFLHCDDSASSYLKLMMDEIFGEKNFRSEIVWTFKRWSNSKKGLLANHQTIFFYSKSDKYKFNTIYCDYSPTTNLDQILQQRERINGKSVYKTDKNGEVIQADEKKGVPLSDVWDIPFLNPKAKERTGYPTQKPIELLERIIKISTDEDDLVLDPFMGSGTTLVAAKLLNRKFIGIDKNKDAFDLAQRRLEMPFKTKSNLLEKGIDSYKNKSEYELNILNQFDCVVVQRNNGIDAFLKRHYKNAPVAIKIQKKSESFEQSLSLLCKAGNKKKCSYMVLISNDAKSVAVPDNVIVLSTLDCQLDKLLR